MADQENIEVAIDNSEQQDTADNNEQTEMVATTDNSGGNDDANDNERTDLQKPEPKKVPDPIGDAIAASCFGEKEKLVAMIWLGFTATYWTFMIWIPTFIRMDFTEPGLFMWCIGFIFMIGCAYCIKTGKYPSGATAEDPFAVNGIGRYACAALTTTICVDIIVLVVYQGMLDIKESVLEKTYVTDLTRCCFHLIHVFWTSLFFYNKFRKNHPDMATRAFATEWFEIMWTTMIAFILNEVLDDNSRAVDITYAVFVMAELLLWILPMMWAKNWGAAKENSVVGWHLVFLDIITDLPIIAVVLAEEGYKDNWLLFIDLYWKSVLLIRALAFFGINRLLFGKIMNMSVAEKEVDDKEVQKNMRITCAWIFWVGGYWTILLWVETAMENEIGASFEYYIWFLGMIGVAALYDGWMAGYSADTTRGNSMMAYTALCLAIDCICHAGEALSENKALDPVSSIVMVFHSITILWTVLFVYQHQIEGDNIKGQEKSISKITIGFVVTEWVDIVFMFIAIIILHTEEGNCFDEALCSGYFSIFTIKLIVWFFPIILGYANTDFRNHLHMVILDTVTDLPLVIIVIATKGYEVHGFIFFDIIFKLLLLLATYSYHLFIGIILGRVEEKNKVEDAQTTR